MGSQTRVPFSPSSLVFERKFDVALRKSHGETFKTRMAASEPSPDDLLLLAASEARSRVFGGHDKWTTNVNLYPHLLLHIADSPTPKTSTKFSRIQKLVDQNLEVQLGWVCDSLEPGMRPNVRGLTQTGRRKMAKCAWLEKLLQAKDDLDTLMSLLPKADEGRRFKETPAEMNARLGAECYWSSKCLDMKVVWSKFSCVVKHAGQTHYLPRPYLLLCHNKICDMISVLVYSCTCPDALYGVDILACAEKFLEIWADLARRLEHKFFNLSKVLEGLCIGETLIDMEGEGNAEFLTNITEGLLTACSFTYEGSGLQRLLRSVSIPVRHELSCLSKTMGHPFCDVEKGAASLHEKVTHEPLICEDAVLQCVRYAKLDFIRKYRARHKQWPGLILDDKAPTSLKKACLLRVDPTLPEHQRKYGPFSIEDMDFITIKENGKFDWLDNFIPYVKDRTVTLGRSAVIRRYIKGMKCTGDNWKETRLLLFHLLQPVRKTDHMWYIQAYNEGDWEQVANYLVIRIVPKEKEHKIESRGFGCKTPMDRARSIVQEENAARFLDQYSDEHVMTLGEISLAKKLLGFRKLGSAYSGYSCLTMSVDSSSWNNRFRHEAVAPVADAVLDSHYGVKVFEKTHTAYKRSFVYMPDADKVYSWDGQLGGIEGLNQDTWVYVYIQQMKVCMEGLPYPYYLLCKGDDLRVAIMVPPEIKAQKSMDVIKKEVLSHVSERGKMFGHVIKVEDSYVSECYFAYSKDAFVDGVEQPQTFRKIQKCYGANNAFLTTVDDFVASSFSNAHSAAKTAPSPIQCFSTALFWAYEAILSSTWYQGLSDEELVALLLTPNLAGGFPIIYLHNFFVRAESDLLSPFIHLIGYCKTTRPRIYQVLTGFLKQKVADPDKAIAGLLVDPYSLPLTRPYGGDTVLRSAVTDLVARTTRNEELRDLFTIVKSGFEKAFLDVVLSADRYNVKLLGVLYSCTPEGVVRSLIRKFETGRSIYNALVLHSSRGLARTVLRKCARADRELHAHRVALIKKKVNGSVFIVDLAVLGVKCPYEIAQGIRKDLWQKPVEGITHPPMQHLIKVGQVSSFQGSDVAAYNHFEIMFDTSSCLETPLFTIGRHDPFTGDSTGRGLHHPDATIISHNVLSSKVRDLMDVAQWGAMTGEVQGQFVTSNLPRLAFHLLKAYTGADAERLMPFQSQVVTGRTTQHHVRVNNFRVSIVPNTLLNLFTRAKGTSHTHVNMYKSTDHFLVNFLHVYCHSVSLWALRWWCGERCVPPDRIWMVTNPECACLQPIEEHPVILANTDLPDLEFISACRVGHEAIREIRQEVEEFNPAQYYVPDDSAGGLTLEEAQIALAQAHCNAVISSRLVVKALYTNHASTSSGYKALERYGGLNPNSATEALDLRYVPPSVLLQDVAVIVYTEILHRFRFDRIRHLGVAIGLAPARELTWTTLLKDLDYAGVWYSIHHELHQRLPAMYDLVHDNPESASASFGAACYEICRGQLSTYKLAYLSYNPSPVVESDVHRRLHAIRLDVFMQVYLSPIECAIAGTLRGSAAVDIPREIAAGSLSIETFVFPFSESGEQETRAYQNLFEMPEEVDEIIADGLGYADDGELEWAAPPLVTSVCRILGLDHMAIRKSVEDMCVEGSFDTYWNAFLSRVGERRVEIFRTSRVTCINRVREGKVPLYHVAGARNCMQAHGFRDITRGRLPAVDVPVFLSNLASQYPPVGYEWGIIPDSEYKGTLYNKRWLLRPLGSGNISMSKALDLLVELGLIPLGQKINAACLGDGLGGYSAVVATFSTEAWILYNTRPNRQGSQQEPIYAQKTRGSHRNEISISENLLGHYDLTETTTYTRFEECTDRLDLVTLDAEMPTMVCDDRVKMIQFVATMFVRLGVPGSVMLMKVTCAEAVQWLGVLGWLTPRCKRVYVVKVPSAPLDGELMVVAQLNAPDKTRPYEPMRPQWPPMVLTTKIHQFAFVKYNRWIAEDEGGLTELGLRPSYSVPWIQAAQSLPIYGWSKLQEVCRLGVDTLCKARGSQTEREWLLRILEYLESGMSQCQGDLQQVSADRQFADYATVRHEAYVLEKYAAIAGFAEVVRVRVAGEDVLTTRHCLAGYSQFAYSYPGRFIDLTLDVDAQREGAIERHDYIIHPFLWWKKGMRWAVGALAISQLI